MNNFDLVFRARRAVTPTGERPAAVAVRDGRIAAIEPYDTQLPARRTVDLRDDEVLLPGMVDTHVHVNEPGRTEWEGFASATRAAAAGGVTTIVDMPLNSLPPTVDGPALAVKRAVAAEKAYIDVGFWGGAIPGNIDELKSLHEAGVFGFKCFLLDSGVPEFPPLTPEQLVQYLTVIGEFDGLMIVHAEDAGAIEHSPAAHGPRYAQFLASRPRGAENTAIAHVIEAARATGARVHILHLSSSDALPMIASAKRDGVRITVETCPHYLVFDADTIAAGATQYKCCPPIREPENQDLLWQGLADGTIDCIVSDHSPCTPELKQLDTGDFGVAWGGIAGLQTALPAVWTQVRERGHSLADVTRWMSTTPAALAGLTHKGGLVVGRDADLAVFAPEETFVVDAAELRHRNPITPYAGRTLAGVVRSTWLRGQELVGDECRGQLLTSRAVNHLERPTMTQAVDQSTETPTSTPQPDQAGNLRRPHPGLDAPSGDRAKNERKPMSVVYRTTAVSTGNGRNGRSRTTDGVLDLNLTTPRTNARPGDPTNPEQLFAAGFSACLHSAVRTVAKAAGVDVTDSSVSVEIGLVKGDSGFSLQAAITAELPGVDRGVAADLLAQAHQRCPYSKAIRGNVDATLTVA